MFLKYEHVSAKMGVNQIDSAHLDLLGISLNFLARYDIFRSNDFDLAFSYVARVHQAAGLEVLFDQFLIPQSVSIKCSDAVDRIPEANDQIDGTPFGPGVEVPEVSFFPRTRSALRATLYLLVADLPKQIGAVRCGRTGRLVRLLPSHRVRAAKKLAGYVSDGTSFDIEGAAPNEFHRARSLAQALNVLHNSGAAVGRRYGEVVAPVFFAIVLSQFILVSSEDDEPWGFAIWGQLSARTCDSWNGQEPGALHPSEWNEGHALCLFEAAAPLGRLAELVGKWLDQLPRTDLAGPTFVSAALHERLARSRPDEVSISPFADLKILPSRGQI